MTFDSKPFHGLCRSLLEEGHTVRFAARGGSMFPFICDGDVLTVAPTDVATLRGGDVILYERTDGRLVAHSLVSKRGCGKSTVLTTRADGLPGPVDRLDGRAVLGRVVAVRKGRRSVSLDRHAWRALSLAVLGWGRISREPGSVLCSLLQVLRVLPGLFLRSLGAGIQRGARSRRPERSSAS